jgi:nucleotide-binding universal stress UspA family protein
MASIHNTQMTLVYVVDSAIVDEIASATSKSVGVINRELESKGQRYLDYLARLAGDRDLQAEQVIRRGIPYSEIADLARERKVDLIIIGRVGCRGPRCALIGSVAERVIEYANCPVLVVSHTPVRR